MQNFLKLHQISLNFIYIKFHGQEEKKALYFNSWWNQCITCEGNYDRLIMLIEFSYQEYQSD